MEPDQRWAIYEAQTDALARLHAIDPEADIAECLLAAGRREEADALFAARTEVGDSNDRFANAQTNYLLTRIEEFDGMTYPLPTVHFTSPIRILARTVRLG